MDVPRARRSAGRRTGCLLGAVALLAAVAGCGGSGDDTADSAPPTALAVVTTVSPLTNIVANIGGTNVSVVGLVPEGVNSHTFEPPPSAAAALASADIVFVNGLGLETPTRDLAEGNRKPGAETVALGELAIPEDEHIYDFSFPREGGKPNPHLWTDPLLVGRYAEVVTDTLASRDPPHADTYRANLDAYREKLAELDEALRAASETLPRERRRLLTYHDAYAYFARDYDWEVIGAIQPSDFEEPSAADVGALIDQVRAEGVPAIFGSEVFPSPVLERIAAEGGARYVDDLRDDDLPGEAGDPEHTLLELLRTNFATMIDALGGDASALDDIDTANVGPDRAEYS